MGFYSYFEKILSCTGETVKKEKYLDNFILYIITENMSLYILTILLYCNSIIREQMFGSAMLQISNMIVILKEKRYVRSYD